jgi:hypothetical protein
MEAPVASIEAHRGRKAKGWSLAPAFSPPCGTLVLVFPELGRSCGSNLVFMGWVDNAFWTGCHAIFPGFSGFEG